MPQNRPKQKGRPMVAKITQLLILMAAGSLSACSSTPVQPDFDGVLPAITRAQHPSTKTHPAYSTVVSHVCVSHPILDLRGNVLRTDVDCW